MSFAVFISEQLDQRRGLQSRLAKQLGVARSTITAWRHGAKPEFEICLRIAIHFKMDPLDIFEMVGDPNYEAVYRNFLERQFGPHALAEAREGLAEAEPFTISEDDLYPNERHANVHRELQLLLDANSKESKAIATMIHLAAQQLDEEQERQARKERDKEAKPIAAKAEPEKSEESEKPARRAPKRKRRRI